MHSDQASEISHVENFRLGGMSDSSGRLRIDWPPPREKSEGAGVRRLGFCDTSSEALKQCREELGGETFSDYAEALQKFKPEIVLICTPPVYHVEEALAALQARATFSSKNLSRMNRAESRR